MKIGDKVRLRSCVEREGGGGYLGIPVRYMSTMMAGPLEVIEIDTAGELYVKLPEDGQEFCVVARDVEAYVEPAQPSPYSDATSKKLEGHASKPRYGLIPPSALRSCADAVTYGARKYEANGWRTVPNGVEVYTDSAMRHLEAFRAGEWLDPESGIPHLGHLMANAAILHELGGPK